MNLIKASLLATLISGLVLGVACSAGKGGGKGVSDPVGDDLGGANGSTGTTTGSYPEQPPFDDPPAPNPEKPPEGEAWSDPATWGGTVPGETAIATVPEGRTFLLDQDVKVRGLIINGILTFNEQDLNLTADWILVNGKLQIGRQNRKFPAKYKATITLTGTDPQEVETMGMGTRGILVMGGILELAGEAPSPIWTRITAHAPAGTDTLVFAEPEDFKSEEVETLNWPVGSELVIAPTDYFEVDGRTETRTIKASDPDKKTVTLDGALEHNHWGTRQFIQNDANAPIVEEKKVDVFPRALDERAEVGNLTRNIMIQGVDDALWKNDLFGAHVMVMYPGRAYVDGVEFFRVGQAGHLARYPMHWHLWSYNSDGSLREDGEADGQYIQNSSIHHSGQRCVVIHATNGLRVENNICYDIKGHAMFLEDAVERRNKLLGNLVLYLTDVSEEHLLLEHERQGYRSGPAGFWMTNPDNEVIGNAVADTDRLGYWYAIPTETLGASKAVDMDPSTEPFGKFENNVAHSTRAEGILFDNVPVNDSGATADHAYQPRQTDADENDQSTRFEMSGSTIYKIGLAGNGPIWDRITLGRFRDMVVADFGYFAFAGSSRCEIQDNLIVGSSLNGANQSKIRQAAVGMASYHSLCSIPRNVFVNLPAVPGKMSGAFAANDYYIRGVDKGLVNNGGSVLINTHPGYHSPPPNTKKSGEGLEHYTYSGALWDPWGYWGDKGSYWVIDSPFLVDDATCKAVKEPVHGNDKSCAGPYFGLSAINTGANRADSERPTRVTRETADGQALGEWFIDDGGCTEFLGIMRNFSLLNGGIYRVDFPGMQQKSDAPVDCTPQAPYTPKTQTIIHLENMIQKSDNVVIGVPFDGGVNLKDVYTTMWANPLEILSSEAWDCYQKIKSGGSCNSGDWTGLFRGTQFRPYSPVSSKAEVINDAECDAYFHDKDGQRVWIKICRGDLPLNGKGVLDVNSLDENAKYGEISLYEQLNAVLIP